MNTDICRVYNFIYAGYLIYLSTQVQGPLRRHQGQVRGRLLRDRAQVQQHRRDGRLHCQGEAQEADSVSA